LKNPRHRKSPKAEPVPHFLLSAFDYQTAIRTTEQIVNHLRTGRAILANNGLSFRLGVPWAKTLHPAAQKARQSCLNRVDSSTADCDNASRRCRLDHSTKHPHTQ